MDDHPEPHNIVIGQEVQEAKAQLARRMRQEMTIPEAILWSRLRRGALGAKFRRQQIIDGFIADFYCHCAKLVVEVDGATHDAAYDAERSAVFASRGIEVIRFKNEDVRERIGFVLTRIRAHLACSG